MLIKNKDTINKLDLIQGNFGLEREALRITAKGKVAQTDHPALFGDRTKHPYIVTDFAEAQVEMVTSVHPTLEAAHQELTLINQVVMRSVQDELLWPYSMPPAVDWNNIRVAEYSNTEIGTSARKYREYLQEKYGNGVQLISGIHYNFSFSDVLCEKLYDASGKTSNYKDFKNNLYLKIARNYLNYHWFLVYMLGKTPVATDIYEEHAISLRNSKYGYQNKVDLNLSYDTLQEYVASIRQAIADEKIIDEREIYAPVRIKCIQQARLIEHLEEKGIGYLEIRAIDLNPRAFAGISLAELKFIHLFMLSLLELPEQIDFDPVELTNNVVLNGLKLQKELASQVSMVLSEMHAINDTFGLELNTYSEVVKQQKDVNSLDFLELARQHKEQALEKPYQTHGYEDMEMSTQLMIAESVKRGVKFSVIDRRANFLRLVANGKREYIKQATKTSLDTYVSYLAMENKEVTKIILEDANFPVPPGQTFTSIENAMAAYSTFLNKEVVVKPKSTNFGWGIVMFRSLTSEKEFENALKIAFGFDTEVIVEQFLHGQEYRFLVVGDECIAVLKRVGANVIGDGTSTIAELVARKNEHPWRGTNHLAPLEKIVLGEIEIHNLKQSGFEANSILKKDEQVFLRDNSNISTGGDSIDVTDRAHSYFKQQAVAAAHAIGANLCGVDLIINGDLSDATAKYGCIELNFNPAIHMHAFTLEGQGVNAAPYVLKQLGLI